MEKEADWKDWDWDQDQDWDQGGLETALNEKYGDGAGSIA